MSKTTFNFWLDFLLLVIFVSLTWVSVVTRFVFPPPSRAGGWLLWGGTYDQWQTIQFGLLCALAGGVLLHDDALELGLRRQRGRVGQAPWREKEREG